MEDYQAKEKGLPPSTALFANKEIIMTLKQEVDRAYQRYQKECGLHLQWHEMDWRAQLALNEYHNIRVSA